MKTCESCEHYKRLLFEACKGKCLVKSKLTHKTIKRYDAKKCELYDEKEQK